MLRPVTCGINSSNRGSYGKYEIFLKNGTHINLGSPGNHGKKARKVWEFLVYIEGLRNHCKTSNLGRFGKFRDTS